MRVVDESIVDIEDGHLNDERSDERARTTKECSVFVCLFIYLYERRMRQDLFDERAKNSDGHRTLTLEITAGGLRVDGEEEESERVKEKEETESSDRYLNGWMEMVVGG